MTHKGKNYSVKMQKYYFCNRTKVIMDFKGKAHQAPIVDFTASYPSLFFYPYSIMKTSTTYG